MSQSYSSLEALFAKKSAIDGALSMLYWDSACMMPEGSAPVREEQLSALSAYSHSLITDPELKALLDAAEKESAALENWQQANLRNMRHHWLHANALDPALVEALTRAGAQCEQVWRKAKPANDWESYLPYQEKVLELVKEAAAAKSKLLKCSPYQAMLDGYDPHRKVEEIEQVFSELKQALPPLINSVLKSRAGQQYTPLPAPVETQRQLARSLFDALGFDLTKGRVDESAHPFCGGVPGDVRITTRYNPDDALSALMGIIHETGHALYESNLPEAWRSQPVGDALGMSMHESQSLFWEMQIARTRPFCRFLSGNLKPTLGQNTPSPEALFHACTFVEKGFIRVDADELTYPLHVILRFEIERELINGGLAFKDVPALWNKKMKDYLGVNVPDYARGCMQDIHWTDGSFGYFPTYTLGAMMAAQFAHTLRKGMPNLDSIIEKGEFAVITQWLRDNIHAHGSRYPTADLLQKVTGQPLSASLYMGYLNEKYNG